MSLPKRDMIQFVPVDPARNVADPDPPSRPVVQPSQPPQPSMDGSQLVAVVICASRYIWLVISSIM